jgi:hypothetical protein
MSFTWTIIALFWLCRAADWLFSHADDLDAAVAQVTPYFVADFHIV